MDVQTLLTILYSLIGWATITTIILILARRDVKMGLKKWFLLKRGQQPIKLRFYGPDKNVSEYILPTKGKGETLTINDKKFLVLKTQEGSTFFLNEEAIRRCDDGINEINYNYKSIMPLDAGLTEEEAESMRKDLVKRIQKGKDEQLERKGYAGVEMENLATYTDPKRLNRLIEFIKLAAKTEALLKATDMEKYVKWTLFISGGTLIAAGLIYWTMDGKVLPLLEAIRAAVNGVGSQVLNLG